VKRSHELQSVTNARYDIAIVGGGVNGCGIARDAAGRGLSVYLCEQGDLAGATSSASTKLLHGGLRYLEFYEFRLVREALQEREVVWRMAPHIVWPLRFVLPDAGKTRSRWVLRLGLFLYDHLGGRQTLPGTRTLDLARDPAGAPLKPELRTSAFEYSDCWIDDARLVALNARDAADRGAVIETRTRATAAERRSDHWLLTTQDKRTGVKKTVKAGILVNAAGPWAAQVLNTMTGAPAGGVRLVQGSHIVVPRLFTHDRCYILQNPDKRIVFAIPYEDDFTLIGTTDLDYRGDPAEVSASAAEVEYLCDAASRYFAKTVKPSDVVWTYSGVRPLYDDGASEARAATRDYVLELEEAGGAPLLSVFGGKITTYRRLSEHALEKLSPHVSADSRRLAGWTGSVPLPGGEFTALGFEALVASLARRFPWLDAKVVRRLTRSYGTRAWRILEGARDRAALGADFGAGLSEAEVRYLMAEEFAVEVEDVIWRRSKLGLRLSPAQVKTLSDFMKAQAPPLPNALLPEEQLEAR
jgi:glycerol-3-phosphate dehydrogenase